MIVWTASAERDVNALIAFERQRSAAMALRAKQVLDQAAGLLLAMPELGRRIAERNAHVLTVRELHCRIFYRRTADALIVLRVRPDAMRPLQPSIDF